MPVPFLTIDARVLFTYLTLNPDSELTPEHLAKLLYPHSDTPLSLLIAAQENLWESFPLSVRLFRGLSVTEAHKLQVPVQLAPQPPIVSLTADVFDLVSALESDWNDLPKPEGAALLTEAAVAIGKGLASSVAGTWLDEWRERLCCLYRDATVRFLAADPALCLKIRSERPFSRGEVRSAPAVRPPFFGRTTELKQLQELLASGERVISLVGLGGAGKTRLALEMLSSLPGELSHWPQARVSLSGVSTRGGLLEALRKGLGQQMGDVLQDGRDPLGAVCRTLQEPTVLFLDNAEDAVRSSSDGEVLQTLGYLVYRCPQVVLISTSRCRVGLPEEFVFPVEGLPLPADDEQTSLPLTELEARYPGLKMLSQSLQAVGKALPTDTAAVVALLRQSGGLPLSIELLATRISKHSASLPSIDEIKRSAGSPRTAIDWAVEPLSGATRAFLQRISIFEGAFAIEDAEAVTGESEVEFRLSELDDAGLLTSLRSDEMDSSTYRLSPAVRDFVRADLEKSSDYPQLLERHAAHFVQLAADAQVGIRGVDRVLWLRRLRQAVPDVLSVIQNNLRVDSQVRFAAEVFTKFCHYFTLESRPHEGISLAKQVIQRVNATGGVSSRLNAEIIDALGRFQTGAGYFQDAEVNLKSVYPFWQKENDIRTIARCANNLAICCDRQGRFMEAKPYYDVAWRGFYELNERRAYAQILQNITYGLKKNSLWQEAYELLKEACEITTTELPEEPLTAKFLFDYAEVLYILEDYSGAMDVLRHVLQLVEVGRDTLRIANTVALFGLIVNKNSVYKCIDPNSFIITGWAISRNIAEGSDLVSEIRSELEDHIAGYRLKEIPVFSENDLEIIRKQILAL